MSDTDQFTRKIDAEIPYPWCKNCSKFEIEESFCDCIAMDTTFERHTVYRCRNRNFCKAIFSAYAEYQKGA